MLPALPPDYYLRNFLLILQTVLTRDPLLFHPDERAQLDALQALPEPALRLYIRLFNRRGDLFRQDKLSYPELGELLPVAEQLCSRGFSWRYTAENPPPLTSLPFQPSEDSPIGEEKAVRFSLSQLTVEQCLKKSLTLEPALTLADVLELYTVPELQGLARQQGIRASGRLELVSRLLALAAEGEGSSREELVRGCLAAGNLIHLRHRPLLELVTRLFFLNDQQDHTTMVTSDLALIQYPRTSMIRTRAVYGSRAELDERRLAEWLQARWYEALEQGESTVAYQLGTVAFQAFLRLPAGLEDFLSRYSARTLFARTALRSLQEAERLLERSVAIQAYQDLLTAGLPGRYRGEAWVRLALLQERSGARGPALETCRAALLETSTRRGERIALEKRLTALEAALVRGSKPRKGRGGSASAAASEAGPTGSAPVQVPEVTVRRPLLHSAPHQRVLFATADGRGLTVEALALEAFRQVGVAGLYSENLLFTTLAGILFWDIYFADVPDVFLTPYQDAPLDLNTDEFYERRQSLIEARLEALRQDPLPLLRAHVQRYSGTVARGVSWETWSLECLEQAVTALGGVRLAFILGHLLEDFPRRRRGLPDLLLWQTPWARDAGGVMLSSPVPLPGDGSLLSAEPPPPDSSSAHAEAFWGEQRFVPPDSVWLAEVKSPRDRLSPEQLAWIAALQQGGIAFLVCKVAECLP